MDIIQCNLLVKIKRKWKPRWVVLRRVNPASARINLYVYKDRLSAISKQKEKFFLSLRDYCGMESVDKENKLPKLVIITALQLLSLRFESREDRDHWVDTIVTEGNFGEDVSFDGVVPSKQTVKSGEVTLHIYPDFFTLVRKQNSRCLGRWKFEQLFNYGTVDGGFVFRVDKDGEKSSEPETYLLLTSLENQINRTFDTVYKTARHMYGSAEGLQRSPKFNPSRAPRPRSMSEPSGFKRFMHRLSLRRKSRRPKDPKWKSGSFTRRLDGAEDAPTTPDGAGKLLEQRSKQCLAASASAEHLSSKLSSASLSDLDSRKSESPTEKKAGLSGSVLADLQRSPSRDTRDETIGFEKRKELALVENNHIGAASGADDKTQLRNGEAKRQTSGDTSMKTSNDQNRCLSGRSQDAGALQPPGSEDDPTVWQRRSALYLNTDDMIEQGFIKTKPLEPRPSEDESLAGSPEGNNNFGKAPVVKAPSQGSGIQVRRNTSGAGGKGGKRPMLTIEIAPSGSEPSLNQAYVNLPEQVKSTRVNKLKQGEWDKYDSEENVYHHLAAVVGPMGYQNLPEQARSQSVNSLDTSYQNCPGAFPKGGHSYENVGAGRGDMHYINVEGSKPQQSVNYIKVAGSGPPTPIQKNSNHSFVSRKGNSDYTEIDMVKTKKLREIHEGAKERVKKN